MKKRTIFYATRSPFKREELSYIAENEFFTDSKGIGHRIGDLIDFRVSNIVTEEPLEIDLQAMVRHKVRSAYRALLAPCIVEHAGLILEKNVDSGFPGGLTQPTWDALSAQGFLDRTGCAGERAIARAVVGYCDGTQQYMFIGETRGTIAHAPRGERGFYWDVVFCPDGYNDKTYAEICDVTGGLETKLKISQSTKALRELAQFLSGENGGSLFDIR